jgi:inorganic pyrophosphatase
MPIELERLEKPLRKLRKSLKHWLTEPSVEMVHKQDADALSRWKDDRQARPDKQSGHQHGGEACRMKAKSQVTRTEAAGAGDVYIVPAVIETPRGSRNKYKLEEKSGRFKLSKIMPEGMVFPFDFGFFPGTRADDGDPLDALVLCDEPTFPGCQVDCRLAGELLARQVDKGETRSKRNDRIIAIAQASLLFAEVKELADLPSVVMHQVEDFFVNYQKVRDVESETSAKSGTSRSRSLGCRSRFPEC